MHKTLRTLLTLACLSLLGLSFAANARHLPNERVFTMTNAEQGNKILQFFHHPEYGLVQSRHAFYTGGKGSGGGLGNQSGIAVNLDARLLFAVNAGSDSLSVVNSRPRGLKLIDIVYSGGERPVSVTQHGDYVYVLNAGSDSIQGFKLSYRGKLTPLPYSKRPLSGSGTAPAQISFSPRGDALIVSEKATNLITTYLVNRDGLPSDPIINASAGATPFGFGFDRYGHLLMSEAASGAEDASSVSSYRMGSDGLLEVLDAASPTTESAACWLVTSRDGRVAFTTNTASQSISAFHVSPDGELMLTNDDGVAASTGVGTSPIDLILTPNGRFVFALSASSGEILRYELSDNNKAFTPAGTLGGLPTSVNGIVVF